MIIQYQNDNKIFFHKPSSIKDGNCEGKLLGKYTLFVRDRVSGNFFNTSIRGFVNNEKELEEDTKYLKNIWEK